MPDADRRVVVVNSTPIITLALVDRLSLLRELYQSVFIPPAGASRDEQGRSVDLAGGTEVGDEQDHSFDSR